VAPIAATAPTSIGMAPAMAETTAAIRMEAGGYEAG
jgi:hypothetical protein